MISPKIFILALLSAASLSARVQLDTNITINHNEYSRTITAQVQLDPQEIVKFYEQDSLFAEVKLLAEGENEAVICTRIYAKNREELLAEPTLVAAYGIPATETISEKTDGAEPINTLQLTITANKF
jgi:hypothetical protein